MHFSIWTHLLCIFLAALAYHLEVLIWTEVLLLGHMTRTVQHISNLFLNKQRMNDKVRLLNNCVENFFTQLSVDTTLFPLKDVIAEHFAQCFDRLTLSITHFCCEGIIQFWQQFFLNTVYSNHKVSLLIGKLLVSVISRDSRREFFGLASLHAKYLLIHASKETMTLIGDFKGIILQI